MFTFDRKEYKLNDVFDAMEAEDVEAGVGAGGTGGGSTSDGGGESGGAVVAERKGIHDIMRLAGIMVEDDVRPLVVESKLQAKRAQLDVNQVGARGELWAEVCERYVDPIHEVGGRETIARVHSVERRYY